ncbi:hypothetical protein M514_14083 [Trichuris suis]|uniref:Uncharacterized protein n=1 Tax=Trichuris suis TaxID=68888 RepID=A0A085MQ99_9BILA|nr:hypothetical protein M513_14083 [Trichuris suis]KFD59395.1 hypothetical protein M514_14083 [Trichuris suis]
MPKSATRKASLSEETYLSRPHLRSCCTKTCFLNTCGAVIDDDHTSAGDDLAEAQLLRARSRPQELSDVP